MTIENKDYYIDTNEGERLEIKNNLGKLEKEIAPNFREIKKIASAMLAATMLSANNIDTSSLPHYAGLGSWIEKHVKVRIEKVQPRTVEGCANTYNAGYYERYNPNARKLENSYYRENIDLPSHIVGGNMKFYRIHYKLLDKKTVKFLNSFLKSENLDKVPVNINGRTYIAKPKFLELDFMPRGKKGHLVYGMGKKVVLVYVPVKTKIVVLGSIVDGEFYEEDHHRFYDISTNRERYKNELKGIVQLLGCVSPRHCHIRKDMDGTKYFYKNNRLVGKVEDYGDKKLVIKGNRVVGKILERGNKVIVIDNQNRIISSFSGSKRVNINLHQTDMNINLYLR